MTTKTIERQVAMELAGVDAQAIVADLEEKHDPWEREQLLVAFREAVSLHDAALRHGNARLVAFAAEHMDRVNDLVLANKREDVAHVDIHGAVQVMTGRISGYGAKSA